MILRLRSHKMPPRFENGAKNIMFTLCRSEIDEKRHFCLCALSTLSKRSKSVTAEVTFPINFAPAQCQRNGETFYYLFTLCRKKHIFRVHIQLYQHGWKLENHVSQSLMLLIFKRLTSSLLASSSLTFASEMSLYKKFKSVTWNQRMTSRQ